jgi:hypothetical protein
MSDQDQFSGVSDAARAAFANAVESTLGKEHVSSMVPSSSQQPSASVSSAAQAAYVNALRSTLGDEGAAHVMSHKDTTQQLQQEPKTVQQPPNRAFIDGAAHALGVHARDWIEGPAHAVEIVTEPIRYLTDKLIPDRKDGPKSYPLGVLASQFADSIGLPHAETDAEKLASHLTQAATGTVATMGAGGLMQKASTEGVKAFGKMLTAGSGSQLAGAVAGAGAADAMKAAGGNEVAQTAAGLLGAVVPGVVGSSASRVSKQIANAAQEAHGLGYVIPPADLNPGVIAEALGGAGGKIKTAQEASFRNQAITNDLARKALGLTPGQDLTIEALDAIRREAGQKYESIAQIGKVPLTTKYETAIKDLIQPYIDEAASFPNSEIHPLVKKLEGLITPEFNAKDAIKKIRSLRNDSDIAGRLFDKETAKTLRNAASAIETALEDHLASQGQPAAQLLQDFRDARQQIAKTYTVQKALNPTTGDVSAQVLANELKKGKPLSDELAQIAQAGSAFPKATQALKETPKAISPLDFATATLGAPIALARPAARSAALSKLGQWFATKNPLGESVTIGPNQSTPAVLLNAAVQSPHMGHSDDENDLSGIAQAQSVDQAIAAATGKPAQPNPTINMRDDGTLAIAGDPATIRAKLAAAGVSSVIPVRGGVLVGRSQANAAAKLLGGQ